MSSESFQYIANVQNIIAATTRIQEISIKTSLEKNSLLSEEFECNVYLKREDLHLWRQKYFLHLSQFRNRIKTTKNSFELMKHGSMETHKYLVEADVKFL